MVATVAIKHFFVVVDDDADVSRKGQIDIGQAVMQYMHYYY